MELRREFLKFCKNFHQTNILEIYNKKFSEGNKHRDRAGEGQSRKGVPPRRRVVSKWVAKMGVRGAEAPARPRAPGRGRRRPSRAYAPAFWACVGLALECLVRVCIFSRFGHEG